MLFLLSFICSWRNPGVWVFILMKGSAWGKRLCCPCKTISHTFVSDFLQSCQFRPWSTFSRLFIRVLPLRLTLFYSECCVKWCVLLMVCEMVRVRNAVWNGACFEWCVKWCVFWMLCEMVRSLNAVWNGACSEWCLKWYVFWMVYQMVCALNGAFSEWCVLWMVYQMVCALNGAFSKWCVLWMVCEINACSEWCVVWCVFWMVCEVWCVFWRCAVWCVLWRCVVWCVFWMVFEMVRGLDDAFLLLWIVRVAHRNTYDLNEFCRLQNQQRDQCMNTLRRFRNYVVKLSKEVCDVSSVCVFI